MILYNFHVYAWPISILKHLDRQFHEGGLSLRSLRKLNEVSLLKLSWFVSSSSQWAQFLRARFIKDMSHVRIDFY